MMKRFEYSPLGKELKAQTDISKKKLQKLDNTDEFFRIKKEKSTIKKYKRSNVIYSSTAFMDIIIINYLTVAKVLLNQNIRFYSRSTVT